MSELPAGIRIGQQIRLRSIDFPEYTIRKLSTRSGTVEKMPIAAIARGGRSEMWVIRKGCSGETISLESLDGGFFKHCHGEKLCVDPNMKLNRVNEDASFTVDKGHSGTGITLRSVNCPEQIVRHRKGDGLYMSKTDKDEPNRNNESSFIIEEIDQHTPLPELPPGIRIGQQIRLRSIDNDFREYTIRKLSMSSGTVEGMPIAAIARDGGSEMWVIRKGSSGETISLESSDGGFIKHWGGKLCVDPNMKLRRVNEDASFTVDKGHAGTTGITLRSVNYPKQIVRHSDGDGLRMTGEDRNNESSFIIEDTNDWTALISLLGPYNPRRIHVNQKQIVSFFTSPATWLFCLRRLDTGRHIIATHPDSTVPVEGSVTQSEETIQDFINKEDHQNKHEITAEHEELLGFLKSKLGLSYLSVPKEWYLSTADQSYLKVSDITPKPADLKRKVDYLADLGLIFTSVYKGEDYIVNTPHILLEHSSWDEVTRSLMYTAGIPLPQEIVTSLERSDVAAGKTVKIRLEPDSTTTDYLLSPIAYLLSYILTGEKITFTITNAEDVSQVVAKVEMGKSVVSIVPGNGCIKVGLTNEGSVTLDILTFSLKLVLKHLNYGCLGKVGAQSSSPIMVLKSQPDPGTEDEEENEDTPMLKGRKVQKMLKTRLEDIPSDKLKLLLKKYSDTIPSHSLDNQEFSVPLKTDVDLLNDVRRWQLLINEHKGRTVHSFYRKLKKDPEYEDFAVGFIKSLGLKESHMQTRRDQINNLRWLIIAVLIATLLLGVTLAVQFVYDIDVGYGGIAGYPIIIGAAAFIKRSFSRNDEGEFANADIALV